MTASGVEIPGPGGAGAEPSRAEYAAHVVRSCHRRRAHAMGGTRASIPVEGDAAPFGRAFAAVQADEAREARLHHGGTWVAIPARVPVAKAAFAHLVSGPNPLRSRSPGEASADRLSAPHARPTTRAGPDLNFNVGMGYVAAWLRRKGAARLCNLVEDAAAAKSSRTQLWQWRATGR